MEKTRERIEQYGILEQECPDCYVTRMPKFLVRSFGVNPLEDQLVFLNNQLENVEKFNDNMSNIRNKIKLLCEKDD